MQMDLLFILVIAIIGIVFSGTVVAYSLWEQRAVLIDYLKDRRLARTIKAARSSAPEGAAMDIPLRQAPVEQGKGLALAPSST